MHQPKLFAGSLLTVLFLFPAFCQAQTISIVAGNGQLVCLGCEGKYAPLVVQVGDATGAPVATTTVTWTATQQGSQPVTATSVTNLAGQATYAIAPLPLTAVTPFAQVTVAASARNGSGALVETAGLSITCETHAGQQAGAVLTNSSGMAACTPLFGGRLGSVYYTVVVGVSYVSFSQAPFSVLSGPPAILKIVSGNNQTVNAGVVAPVALVAQVTDAGGNPSAGIAVKWFVTAGAAILSDIVSSSLSDGDVSATATLVTGPAQVTVSLPGNSSVQAVFTVNLNTVVTAMQAISGNNQQALEGAAFADPLIVQVNDNAAPVPGATVNFAVSSGAATLSAASAATNAQGQAQVTVTAGALYGPVAITASVKSGSTTYTQTFNLTVNPPSIGGITAIVNAAGFQNQFVSPCSLATIYRTGLASGLQGVASAIVAPQTQVAGVSVQFGGVLAPILYVANVNGQESVSVQVPCEVPSSAAVPPATVPVVATVNGSASQPFAVTVLPFSPGIFQFTDSDGQRRAVLLRQDGSFASVTNPARSGDTLRMFVTGLGQTTPTLFTDEFDPLTLDAGNWVPQYLPVIAGVLVGVNNTRVPVLSAKYAYGSVGVYEVDFQLPQNAAPGNNATFAIVVYEGADFVFGN